MASYPVFAGDVFKTFRFRGSRVSKSQNKTIQVMNNVMTKQCQYAKIMLNYKIQIGAS